VGWDFLKAFGDEVGRNLSLFEFVSDSDFSPLFLMKFTDSKGFCEPFFVQKIMLNQMHHHFVPFVLREGKTIEFLHHFEVATFLIGTVVFHFLNDLRQGSA